ncbi:Rrf2 family transcriptional regulator [Candidatus Sulfurimonas marisnigri]|uniref:Rrf2 family transcriptional regulator n=1 Tax=Candidatus Sulfurimonas marisnigri TaxID=2740405 RepID=A0A7S7RR97_9BACT|nr:Rrf2 family transcriptional regulator [Candidatus Sulfurimonas marisnigri]QOY55484.1 Rrf2 family transcriptional regulator [Candidatus Sulfurimonas marisnigri]
MQLNNTSQYAIRILSYIANTNDNKLCNAKELSEILDIPYKFLTKIMTHLVKAEFVISIQGREGGYKLAKPASGITVMDVLNEFNEPINHQQCLLGIGTCDGKNKCSLHDQWAEPKSLIKKMFEETTLENIEGKNFKS